MTDDIPKKEEEERELNKKISEGAIEQVNTKPEPPIPEYEEKLFETPEDKEERELEVAVEEEALKSAEESMRQEFYEKIREKIRLKVLEFLEEDDEDKMLVVNAPAGTGKSVNTGILCQIFDNEIHTIFLGQRVEQVEKLKEEIEKITNKSWKHIKGIEQFLDEKLRKNLEEFNKYYVNISELFKEQLEEKGYYEQLKTIKKGESWFGQIAHLNTQFVKDSFRGVNKRKLLVLDENPIGAFSVKKEVDIEDLWMFMLNLCMLGEYDMNENKIKISEIGEIQLNSLILICKALIKIIEETNKENKFRYLEFVDKLNEEVGGLQEIEHLFELRSELSRLYREHQIDVFIKNPRKELWFKDIFEDLVLLVMVAYKHYVERNDNSFIAHTHYVEVEKSGKRFGRKYLKIEYINWLTLKESLGLSKVIILDASADDNIYKLFAEKVGKKLEIWSPDIPKYERKIIQFTDGFYYKESLKTENTWKRIMGLVKLIIKIFRNNGFEGMINLVITKELKNKLEDEMEEFKNIRIRYFGDIRGLNEMKNDKVLIVVGECEPNVNELRDEVECWFLGERKIGLELDKTKEGKFYKDKWLQTFVEQKREREVEQTIERLRFYLASNGKICFFISKLSISFPTTKVKINEFLMRVRIVETLKKRGPCFTVELYNNVKGNYVTFRKCLNEMISEGIIKKEKIIEGSATRGYKFTLSSKNQIFGI
jgi:hypothetical protein